VAATTTTIKGVQILTRKRARRADVFDIALSNEGIQVLRPGRTAQHMGWDRISQWEIAERSGYVLLTLRGDGAVTPLVVRGWTLEDLEVVMRDVTAGSLGTETVPDTPDDTTEHVVPGATQRAEPEAPLLPEHETAAEPERATQAESAAPGPRQDERRVARGRTTRSGVPWRTVATVSLLCLLAAAVTLVLLQSAGIISWGFLGPTA
jgi:hypothetical protein